MSFSGPVPFPSEIKDPAYNSVPSSSDVGWIQAPGSTGTQLNGLPMSSPFPGVPTRSVQNVSENYSDGANKAVVGQPLMTVCSDLPRPSGGDEKADYELAQFAAKKKTQLTVGQGLVANVGELTFVHAPRIIEKHMKEKQGNPAAKLGSEYDPVAQILMPGNDETMVAVQGMNIPEFNKYLAWYDDYVWSLEDVDNLLDHINFYGVVEATGPGNNAILERNVKSYIHAVERKCSVSDIWDSTKTRAGACLFLWLVGESRGALGFQNLRVVPHVRLDVKEELLGTKTPGGKTVMHEWFVGTYRALTQVRPVQGTVLQRYLSGENSSLQQMLPLCEINLLL